MKDDYFTLLYNEEKKIIKIPNTFEELENIFKIKFNESDANEFNFQYIDSEEDEILLDKDNYNYSIKDIKKLSHNHLITVYKCDRDKNNKIDYYYKNIDFEEEENDQEEKKEVTQPDPLKSGTNFSKMKNKELTQPDPLISGSNFTKMKEKELIQLDPLKSGINFTFKKGIKKSDISIPKKINENNGNKEDEFIPRYDVPLSLTRNKELKKNNNNLENSSQSNKEVKKEKKNQKNIISSSSEEKDKKEDIILLDAPIPTLDTKPKTKQIENDGKKYICKFQIIEESIDVSIYLLNLLKYKGNITLEKIKAQIIQFSENNINEVLEEILLNLDSFSIIKENDKYKLKIKFYILGKEKNLLIDLEENYNDENSSNNDLIIYYENIIKEKDKTISELEEIIKFKDEIIKFKDKKIKSLEEKFKK